MESFHEFMLKYKGNPKNKDFIYNVLKEADESFINALIFSQNFNDINKIISIQNYKSYIRQDIDLNY